MDRAVVGTRRVYNDRLLMFMLRNRSSKRFAADSLHGGGAATRSHFERRKREWRKEWEEEMEARDAEDMPHSLDTRLDRMRERPEAAQRLGLEWSRRMKTGMNSGDIASDERKKGDRPCRSACCPAF